MAQIDRQILREYRETKQDYLELEPIVYNMIKNAIDRKELSYLAIHHRVKEKSSLASKVSQHRRTYTSLADVTDVLGFRVITFFSDDVDTIGELVEDLFEVDWRNSVDKRAMIQATAFGYLSLHYICSLKDNEEYPDRLKGKKFEIQIRSGLQHIWAEIEHDLGYKSKFGVPREIRREFSKIAGLLEIADDEFVQVRNGMNQYVKDIREKIILGEARDLPLSVISLTEYIHNNKKMQEYLHNMANIGDSELSIISPESYMDRLSWLGINTLGDMERLLENNKEMAYKMEEDALSDIEIEVFLSSVGLRYLCRAELLRRKATRDQIIQFFRLTEKKEGKAERMADKLLAYKQEKDS